MPKVTRGRIQTGRTSAERAIRDGQFLSAMGDMMAARDDVCAEKDWKMGVMVGCVADSGVQAGVNKLCASCQLGCKQDAWCEVVMCPRYAAIPRQEVLPMRVGRGGRKAS